MVALIFEIEASLKSKSVISYPGIKIFFKKITTKFRNIKIKYPKAQLTLVIGSCCLSAGLHRIDAGVGARASALA